MLEIKHRLTHQASTSLWEINSHPGHLVSPSNFVSARYFCRVLRCYQPLRSCCYQPLMCCYQPLMLLPTVYGKIIRNSSSLLAMAVRLQKFSPATTHFRWCTNSTYRETYPSTDIRDNCRFRTWWIDKVLSESKEGKTEIKRFPCKRNHWSLYRVAGSVCEWKVLWYKRIQILRKPYCV